MEAVLPKGTTAPPGFASETILLVSVSGGLVDRSAKSPQLDPDPTKDQQQVIVTLIHGPPETLGPLPTVRPRPCRSPDGTRVRVISGYGTPPCV